MKLFCLASLALASVTVRGLGATWLEEAGFNCYAGHGGQPINPSDTPLKNLALADCEAACEKSGADCTAVVRQHSDGQGPGNCWLRSSVSLPACQRDNSYDTYMAPVSPTPAPPPRLASFIALGDWGYDDKVHGNVKPGCQQAIADAMRQKAQELGDVKFVVNVGDSFYPNGVATPSDPQWQSKWLQVYGGNLTSLPWFSVYGNHDYNGMDKCACSLDTSGCAQINASSNGVAGNWVMPNSSYFDARYLNELSLEIVALDMNTLWAQETCGYTGCEQQCYSTLAARAQDAVQLVEARAKASTAKNMIVFSHYPTDYLGNYPGLMQLLSDNSSHEIQYFGGHRHNTDQSSTKPIAPNVDWLVGGGGGWSCDGQQQGFVVGYITESGMTTESVLVPPSECC